MSLPETINYRDIPGLSLEIIEKLDKMRPGTLGEIKKYLALRLQLYIISICIWLF